MLKVRRREDTQASKSVVGTDRKRAPSTANRKWRGSSLRMTDMCLELPEEHEGRLVKSRNSKPVQFQGDHSNLRARG